MKKFKVYCAATLATFFCATALAGSPDKAPVTIPDYSGYYVGGNIGFANGDFKLISRSDVLPDNFILNSFGKLAPEAFAVRLDMGYGRQLGQFYVGGYLQGQYQNLFRNSPILVNFPPFPGLHPPHNREYFSAALRYTYGFGLKTGFLIAPRTLLFFKAGIAWANFKFKTILDSYNPLVATDPLVPVTSRSHQNLFGGEFGIGLERHLSRHWSIAIKYLYSMFGSITRNFSERDLAIRDNTTKYRVALSSVFAGVNYYFNPRDYDAEDSPESVMGSDYFNTIFLGLYGGLAYQTSSASLIIPTAGVSSFYVGLDHSKWSGLGGAEIGIGHVIHRRFYLGAVAHGDLNYMRSTIYYHAFTGNTLFREFTDVFKAQQYWGIAAKLGVLLSPKTLFYSKIGAVWGRFTVETYKFERNVGVTGIFNGALIKNKVGTQVGLGIEQYLNEHFSVHLEDVYSFYPTLNFHQQQNTELAIVTVIHKIRPDFNIVDAGFDYYFSL